MRDTNLKRRMIISDDCCDHCKGSPEDMVHALWSCPLLSPMWTHDPCWNFRASQSFATFRDLVEHFIETGVDLNYFATIVWTIWHRKNALRTTAKPCPVQQVLHEARSAQATFVRSIPPKRPDQGSGDPQQITWKPPVSQKLKVNFDGAVFREEQRAGVGVIIRDEHGSVIATMAENFPLPFSINAVEVIAAKKALKFALELGLSAIVLKGDSKYTMDALLSEEVSLADIGHLIEEAKLYVDQLDEVEFVHVKRPGNKTAHNIARYASHVSKFSV
ncbi:uncharacterized protein LOC142639686 [Castanea sativa]|uniref:uncharacterized protein LOC142639686 n=1 Tax=Castanea sativa TaxID=21020 RepID=UPI003F6540A0